VKRPEGFDRPEEQLPATRSRPAKPPRKPPAPATPPTPRTTAPRTTAPAERAPRARRETAPSPREAAAAERAEARARRRQERAEARRFTRHTRRRRITWLSVVGVVLVLAGVLAVAVYSPLLALRTITIDGTKKLDAAEIRSSLDGQLGTPLALLDFSRIQHDLARFTLIRSYVTETVPPGTLLIHVVERQAIAVVRRGDVFDQVDAAGVVLATSTSAKGFPVIDIGSHAVTSSAFAAAVQVLLAMPSSVADKVETVTATTADNVRLSLTGTTQTVLWGGDSDSGRKASALAVMLKRPECRSREIIDVSAPLAPVCGRDHAPAPTPTDSPAPTDSPTTSDGAPSGD
jgi:cell division protein FtsQ